MHSHTNHLAGTPWPGRHGWSPWRMTPRVAILGAMVFILAAPSLAQAKTFHCGAADVACLIAAITEANGNGQQEHEIRLEAGLYTVTEVDNTTDGPNGLPSVTSTLTIQGAGAEATILERQTVFPFTFFRLVHVAETGTLRLNGLTLRRGSGNFRGGGLFNQGGTVIIEDSLFAGNTGVGASGGGGLFSQGGSLAISETIFTGNFGGPRAVGGGLVSLGPTTIATSSFLNNRASGNCDGLWLGGSPSTITNTVIAYNSASAVIDALGGGLCGGSGTIVNTTIAQNSVSGTNAKGGGIYGSGMFILNSTIVDNMVLGDVYPLSGGISAGGGIYHGAVVLVNTILARNTVASSLGKGPDCYSSITSEGSNLIGDPTDCGIALQPTDLTGESGLDVYTDDGTPGDGHVPLLPTSRAINAGNDATCPKKDQVGEQRVGPCDIGAIEFQGKTVGSR